MVAAANDLLGIGLYTPEEAALYARVKSGMMRRWLYGSAAGEAVLRPEKGSQENQIVTFLDFIQTLAVRTIRQQHKVPLQKIRTAIERAEQEYSISYPFARMHTTFLFNDNLVIKIGSGEYVELTGRHPTQRLIAKVAEFYMKDLTFTQGGLAEEYRAFRWGEIDVTMNPSVRLGEPLVASCGYSARSLWEAFQAEGSIEAAAEAYGVNAEEVETGCRYFDYILPR